MIHANKKTTIRKKQNKSNKSKKKNKYKTFDTLPRPDVISPARRFHLSFIFYISIAQEADTVAEAAAAALIGTLCYVW